MSVFSEDIKKFNGMYRLPVTVLPSLENLGVDAATRLKAFKEIITEEVNEVDEIIENLGKVDTLDTLVALADWLGDLQVYAASEMAKFGLPLDEVLHLIMQSNFSKMGADGNPIYDERGKLQKGPSYWKPEPMIKSMLDLRLKDPARNMG